MCTRITRTHQACSRLCSFHTNPARIGSGSRQTCLKYTEYRWMKKYATTISEGTFAKCFIEAKYQRYTTTQRERTRVSVLYKQTYYYGSKQQEEAVPICSTTIL